MDKQIFDLVHFLKKHNGINDKIRLTNLVSEEFRLTRDRSVYYNKTFAIRFSSSSNSGFSNTILSLSNLQKYDNLPFLVCLVTPTENIVFLGNTTFLKKISHSSQELRINNIRGSFNGSDIMREFEGISNTPDNIGRLFAIHKEIGFDENLPRLVETTNNISPSGIKYSVNSVSLKMILASPKRASEFALHDDYLVLKNELDKKVNQFKTEILCASLIENVNIRGRVIEYLIAGKDEQLREELIYALKSGERGLPHLKVDHSLGDYHKRFDLFDTETDVKTKIMVLNSAPKAYNIDKMLEFLSQDDSVFMFYFVGVDPERIVNTVLVSMFQKDLLRATIVLRHWAGRNSRGVTQLEGNVINSLILNPNSEIEAGYASEFLKKIVAL